MKRLDPHNPVSQVFFLKCRIHPATQPELEKREPEFKAAQPDAAAHFDSPEKTTGEKIAAAFWW